MPDFHGRSFGERRLRGQSLLKLGSKTGREYQEKLKGKLTECSPEQIRECHGEVVEHPCIEKK